MVNKGDYPKRNGLNGTYNGRIPANIGLWLIIPAWYTKSSNRIKDKKAPCQGRELL
jgi:hypothetical protein